MGGWSRRSAAETTGTSPSRPLRREISSNQREMTVTLSNQLILIAVWLAGSRGQLLQDSRHVPIALNAEIGHSRGPGNQRHEMEHLERRQIRAEGEDVLV